MSGSATSSPRPARRIRPVRSRGTFDRLARTGFRGRSGPVWVGYVQQNPSSGAEVAYAVGRPVGGAVARNRLRRRLRALVADAAPGLPTGAYLVGAGPEAARLGFEELKMAMRQAVERATAGPDVPSAAVGSARAREWAS